MATTVAVRSFFRLGSSVSFIGMSRLGATVSVLDFVNIGASMSVRSFKRIGSSVSVYMFSHIGSSLSLRGFARLGSSLSISSMTVKVLGENIEKGYFSVKKEVHLGSSISVRSFARLGSALSVFGFAHIGSSLSLRGFARLGSTLAIRTDARLSSRFSLIGNMNMGSSLSVRSFIRLASTVSSSAAVPVYFHSDTYMKSSTSDFSVYVGGTASAVADASGSGINKLVGLWNADNEVMTSDRRKKQGIQPLRRTLQEYVKATEENTTGGPRAKATGDGALWMLRQLRPVSYSFKKSSESKYMRFGFIADEVESVMPQLVRTLPDKKTGLVDQKGLALQDMLALLASAGQSQQGIIETQDRLMDQVTSEFEAFKSELKLLKQMKLKKAKMLRLNRAVARWKRRRLTQRS